MSDRFEVISVWSIIASFCDAIGSAQLAPQARSRSGSPWSRARESQPLASAALRTVRQILRGHKSEGLIQPPRWAALDAVLTERVNQHLTRRRAPAQRFSDQGMPDAPAASR
jgi:hypothetical protein